MEDMIVRYNGYFSDEYLNSYEKLYIQNHLKVGEVYKIIKTFVDPPYYVVIDNKSERCLVPSMCFDLISIKEKYDLR